MHAAIVEHPIDVSRLIDEVASTSQGASVIFIGTVRDMNDGRAVTALDYRAYVPMAERELAAIIDDTVARWPGATIACEHRVGSLGLGDASIVIAASHPHRGEAFDACRHVIEQVKHRLPVWKREHYADGELAWVEGCSHAGAAP